MEKETNDGNKNENLKNENNSSSDDDDDDSAKNSAKNNNNKKITKPKKTRLSKKTLQTPNETSSRQPTLTKNYKKNTTSAKNNNNNNNKVVLKKEKLSKKSTLSNEKLSSLNGGLKRIPITEVPFFLRNVRELNLPRYQKAEDTLLDICRLRKFTDIKSDPETLIVRAKCGEKHVFMKIFKTFNVRIAEEEIRQLPHTVNNYASIVFVMEKFSAAFFNAYVNNSTVNEFLIFEYFLIEEIQFNVTNHILQPKFELVENDVFYCNQEKLPQLLKTDMVCRFYKFPPGSVIKITRKFQNETFVIHRAVEGKPLRLNNNSPSSSSTTTSTPSTATLITPSPPTTTTTSTMISSPSTVVATPPSPSSLALSSLTVSSADAETTCCSPKNDSTAKDDDSSIFIMKNIVRER